MSNKIDEIRARWAATTPGPWDARDTLGGAFRIIAADLTVCEVLDSDDGTAAADAIAIGHAPADVAHLLGEVERLEALFQQTHGVHHSWVAEGQRLRGEVERLRSGLEDLETDAMAREDPVIAKRIRRLLEGGKP